jgi:hypothetical protein
MTAREQRLGAIVGAAIALGLGYKAVSYFFIEDYRRTTQNIINAKTEIARLDKVIASEPALAKQWRDEDVERTFSYDRNEAQGRFGMALKEIAKRHGFADAVFAPAPGTRIGVKTDISTVAHRITIDGAYQEAVAFLRDLYRTPYLCQITKLSVSHSSAKGSRGRVKVELTAEAPLLPKIEPAKIPPALLILRHVSEAEPLSPEAMTGLSPARGQLRGDEYFAILADRNLFRSHLPPPENVVQIDNQDRRMVAVKVRFLWEGKTSEQRTETIAGKTPLPVKGKGDVVEITGTYADGVAFGPKQMNLTGQKEWTYTVASHSPPTVIELAVDNQSPEQVYLDVVVTTKEGQQKNEPRMVFQKGTADVRSYLDMKSVRVTALYPDGKPARAQVFEPRDGKQTYTVTAEQSEPAVVERTPEPVPEVNDPEPADGTLTVSGLAYYPDPKTERTLVLEMIATGTEGRKIFRGGVTGAVDGGTLVTVVPSLGAIVKMPTGNYYIYPLGRSFASRVKLNARTDEELPAAIDKWTSSKSASSDDDGAAEG